MLQNKAMLANLSISRWSARRTDKRVTKEVTDSHGASADSGDFRKALVDSRHLQALMTSAGAIRAYHYKMTLPWDDDGRRILPSQHYMAYTDENRRLRMEDERLRREFCAIYPQLVADAPKRLGSMYRAEDFPPASQLADKFGIKITFEPVPDAADFRVDVSAEDAEAIKSTITAETNVRFQAAMKDCYKRLQSVVERLSTTLHQEEPRIYDTLITNARDLVECLPAFNLADDPLLNALRNDLAGMLVSPDELRRRPSLRKATADAADEILAKMTGYAA